MLITKYKLGGCSSIEKKILEKQLKNEILIGIKERNPAPNIYKEVFKQIRKENKSK